MLQDEARSTGGTSSSRSSMAYHSSALLHATAAAAVTASITTRAAALTVAGEALMHKTLLHMAANSSSSNMGDSEDDVQRHWIPWPGPIQQQGELNKLCHQQQLLQEQPSSEVVIPESTAAVAGEEDATAAGTASAAAVKAGSQHPELESPAKQLHMQAVSTLEEGLAVALGSGCFATARQAALGLVRCYGVLQPDLAAEYLAVAQSAGVAAYMKEQFCR